MGQAKTSLWLSIKLHFHSIRDVYENSTNILPYTIMMPIYITSNIIIIAAIR
jgi:hypothetical protein